MRLWLLALLILTGCNGALECTDHCNQQAECGFDELTEACVSRCMDSVELFNSFAPHCGDWERAAAACSAALSCSDLESFNFQVTGAQCEAYFPFNRPDTCWGGGPTLEPVMVGR